jgi:diguanylate cyclase (GGDEF)-like protein
MNGWQPLNRPAGDCGENARPDPVRATMPRLLSWPAALLLAAPLVCGQAPHPAQALVDRSASMQRSRPDESHRLALEAIAMFSKQPNADLELRARTLLCSYYSERDVAAAQREVADAERLVPQLRRSALRAGILGCKGEILEYAGENARAMSFYEQAVAIAEAADEKELLAAALFQRGYLRGVQGEYATGLVDLRRAQSLYEKLGLSQEAAGTLNGIAIVYNRMGDFAQSRDYYQQTLAVQHAAGLLREQAVTWHNLGRANENLGDWNQARAAFETSLGLCREITYKRGEAHALRGLASVRNAIGDPKAALAFLAEAETLVSETPDARLHAQIQLQRGIALRLLKRPADGLPAIKEALSVFQHADSPAELVVTYGALAATQADLGDWRGAYGSQRELNALADKLLQRQLDQRFATLKVAFDAQAKDKENQALLRERDVVERALAQSRKAGQLQLGLIAVAGLLLAILAFTALRLHRTTARMRVLALTDDLTGLPNRRAVLARLADLLAQRSAKPCAVMIADLDNFKTVNDRLGHGIGDEVLRAVGTVLADAVRDPVFVGRLGGEEFLVVLPETDLESARQAAERIREQVRELDTRRWLGDGSLTVSLGVTVARTAHDSMSDMLRRADIALYAAKHSGRDRVVTREP